METEFKAYMHQKISEIEDFFTSSMTVEIKKMNIKKMIPMLKEQNLLEYDMHKGATHCYKVSVKESTFKIHGCGFGATKFEALDNAKKALEQELIKMNDEAISTKERTLQINRLLSSNNKIH